MLTGSEPQDPLDEGRHHCRPRFRGTVRSRIQTPCVTPTLPRPVLGPSLPSSHSMTSGSSTRRLPPHDSSPPCTSPNPKPPPQRRQPSRPSPGRPDTPRSPVRSVPTVLPHYSTQVRRVPAPKPQHHQGYLTRSEYRGLSPTPHDSPSPLPSPVSVEGARTTSHLPRPASTALSLTLRHLSTSGVGPGVRRRYDTRKVKSGPTGVGGVETPSPSPQFRTRNLRRPK